MNRRSLLLGPALSAGIAFTGVAPAAAKTLKAVATFTVLADVVKNVGGDHVHQPAWTERRSP